MCDDCKRTCSNCGKTEVKGFGMCNNCYRYFKRNGTMRPLDEKVLKSRLKYPECSNCGKKNPGGHDTKFQHGLCHSCLMFYRKHGRHSTEQERQRYRQEKTVCVDCKERIATYMHYCERCYNYRLRTGKKRPKRRLDAESCINCGVPLGDNRPNSGLCRRCYRYQYEFKKDRPEHLWKSPHGWCDCSTGDKPVKATHIVTVRVMHHDEHYPLCDACYAEHQRQVAWYGSPDITTKGNIQPKRKTAQLYGDD